MYPLTLEGLDAEDQMRAASAFLNGLFDADRDHWYPMLVAVDEAQLFAPAIAGDTVGCIGVSEVGGGSDVAAVNDSVTLLQMTFAELEAEAATLHS